MKPETLVLPCTGGRHEAVAGTRVGTLFVHRSLLEGGPSSAHWSVSHAESGLLMAAGFPIEDDALGAATALAILADWDAVVRRAALGRAPGAGLRDGVARIVRSWGGDLADAHAGERAVYARRRYCGDA